jgi:hypothetical protein
LIALLVFIEVSLVSQNRDGGLRQSKQAFSAKQSGAFANVTVSDLSLTPNGASSWQGY